MPIPYLMKIVKIVSLWVIALGVVVKFEAENYLPN